MAEEPSVSWDEPPYHIAFLENVKKLPVLKRAELVQAIYSDKLFPGPTTMRSATTALWFSRASSISLAPSGLHIDDRYEAPAVVGLSLTAAGAETSHRESCRLRTRFTNDAPPNVGS